MNIELDKVVIDVRGVAAKLAFLVGKTILFRNGHGDSATVTPVLAIKAENSPGTEGRPSVSIYTTVGVQTISNSNQFNNIMVLEPDGSLKLLGDYTDQMGIVFK